MRYPGGAAAEDWYDYNDQGGLSWLASQGVTDTTHPFDKVDDVLAWCRDASMRASACNAGFQPALQRSRLGSDGTESLPASGGAEGDQGIRHHRQRNTGGTPFPPVAAR